MKVRVLTLQLQEFDLPKEYQKNRAGFEEGLNKVNKAHIGPRATFNVIDVRSRVVSNNFTLKDVNKLESK